MCGIRGFQQMLTQSRARQPCLVRHPGGSTDADAQPRSIVSLWPSAASPVWRAKRHYFQRLTAPVAALQPARPDRASSRLAESLVESVALYHGISQAAVAQPCLQLQEIEANARAMEAQIAQVSANFQVCAMLVEQLYLACVS